MSSVIRPSAVDVELNNGAVELCRREGGGWRPEMEARSQAMVMKWVEVDLAGCVG